MLVRDACPGCGSTRFKKNGHIHRGKQNHRCKACGRPAAMGCLLIVYTDLDASWLLAAFGECQVMG
jgi:hypothetical protein